MQTPLVSVYITNYNYGKYLKKAVESVLHQSMQDFEIIIIDDGSTDNSKSIIEEYEPQDNIRVIYQQNKGLNVTNNIALRTAHGKFIMRLDADDYLDSNALLVLSSALENDPELGLVFPDYFLVDEHDNITHVEKRHAFDREVSLFDQPAHGACTMIRKEFLRKINGYDEEFSCQDGYDLWVRFISQFKVTNVPTPLFYYRQHGENLTKNEDRLLNTRKRIKEKHLSNTIDITADTIAIIPVRNGNIALEKLGNTTVLGKKIDTALNAERIHAIVISSPDDAIKTFVESNYAGESKVLFHHRSGALARLNSSLFDTALAVLEFQQHQVASLQNVMMLAAEYPFVESKTIDDAVNTLDIFKADSLITVRPETNTFFQHSGEGMAPILNQEKFTKLEREALYKYTGGITVARIEGIQSTTKLIHGKVGHVVIKQLEGTVLKSEMDLTIARMLLESHVITKA